MDAIEQIKIIERQSDKKISEWQSNIALLTINVHINYLKSQFKRNKKITKCLNDVKQDVLKNVSYFVDEDKEKEKQQQMNPAQRNIVVIVIVVIVNIAVVVHIHYIVSIISRGTGQPH